MEAIRRMRREGYGPAEVFRQLEASEEFGNDFVGEAGRKKVQRIIREDLKPIDDSGEWSFAEAHDPPAARLILDVLAHLIETTENRVHTLTNLEAEWIIRLRSAYPDMPLSEVWRYSSYYVGAQLEGEDTRNLDRFISFEPWSTDGYDCEDAQFAISLLFDPTRPVEVKEHVYRITAKERQRRIQEDADGETRK